MLQTADFRNSSFIYQHFVRWVRVCIAKVKERDIGIHIYFKGTIGAMYNLNNNRKQKYIQQMTILDAHSDSTETNSKTHSKCSLTFALNLCANR